VQLPLAPDLPKKHDSDTLAAKHIINIFKGLVSLCNVGKWFWIWNIFIFIFSFFFFFKLPALRQIL
jgi:hypothetical protein